MKQHDRVAARRSRKLQCTCGLAALGWGKAPQARVFAVAVAVAFAVCCNLHSSEVPVIPTHQRVKCADVEGPCVSLGLRHLVQWVLSILVLDVGVALAGLLPMAFNPLRPFLCALRVLLSSVLKVLVLVLVLPFPSQRFSPRNLRVSVPPW